MRQVEASLPSSFRNQTGFLLVTFDSEHDTPHMLSAYRSERDLSRDRWTILRGDARETRALAEALGVSYARDPMRRFLHSAQITVMDQGGHIIHRAVGVHADLTLVVNAILSSNSQIPSTRPSEMTASSVREARVAADSN